MTDETKAHVAEYLNRFPEVWWDRLTEDPEQVHVYGWIERPDGRSDFLLMEFWNMEEGTPGFTTSSAEMSPLIAERLYGAPDGEFQCQRVEDVLGDLVTHKIRLTEKVG